jgi:monothiol glutaredoxin
MDYNLKIKQLVKENDVILFMKGSADAPMCGFSGGVVRILRNLNVNFLDVDVLQDQLMRQGIKDFSKWPTIPQLYIKEEFIGGFDIIKQLYETKELFEILDKIGVKYKRD